MRKRLTALFSVAALCATFIIATAPQASAGAPQVPVEFGFGCDFNSGTVYFGIEAQVDITVSFPEIGADNWNEWASVEYLHEDTGVPVGPLQAGERAWAAIPDALLPLGPSWTTYIEVDVDGTYWDFDIILEFDPCALELVVAAECSADGSSALLTVTANNDSTNNAEFLDGEVWVDGVGTVPLSFDPAEVAAGTSSTSAAIELPGDLDANGVVLALFDIEGAMNNWPGDLEPWNVPMEFTWLFSIDGCDVDDEGGSAGPPPGGGQQPAAAVAAQPTFTG